VFHWNKISFPDTLLGPYAETGKPEKYWASAHDQSSQERALLQLGFENFLHVLLFSSRAILLKM
jgi:hypothetical protein